ncbi:MAG: hypothetical protein HRF46_11630 [Acidobacteriota bacterium]|jgi:hypothetical protein
MRTVALVVVAVVASGLAPTAQAQVGWLGVAAGTSWTWNGDSSALVRADDAAVGVLMGVSLDKDALLRLRGVELPMGDVSGARMRGLTVGVDYFFPGVVGEALFSAGLGGYRLNLPEALREDPDHGRWELGYYLGIGEWFALSRRTRITIEVTWDRSRHDGSPAMLSALAGFVVAL